MTVLSVFAAFTASMIASSVKAGPAVSAGGSGLRAGYRFRVITPLEGLVMATRSGSVDPGLVLWLAERERLSPGSSRTPWSTAPACWGWPGSADMRAVLARADGGEADMEPPVRRVCCNWSCAGSPRVKSPRYTARPPPVRGARVPSDGDQARCQQLPLRY